MAEPRVEGPVPILDVDLQNKLIPEYHVIIIYEPEVDAECPLKCSVCGKRFKYWARIRHHANSHTSNGEYRIKCSICGRIFLKLSKAKFHKACYEQESNAIFQCPYENCKRHFNKIYQLNTHIKTHLDKIRSIQEKVQESAQNLYADPVNISNQGRNLIEEPRLDESVPNLDADQLNVRSVQGRNSMDAQRVEAFAPNLDKDPLTRESIQGGEMDMSWFQGSAPNQNVIYEPQIDSDRPFRCGVCGMRLCWNHVGGH